MDKSSNSNICPKCGYVGEAAAAAPVSVNNKSTLKFQKIFTISEDERLIKSFSCALVGDILFQGTFYVSKNFFCFYTKIANRRKLIKVPVKDVVNLTREKTAGIIPNAIAVHTKLNRYLFTSFVLRDSAFRFMCDIWDTRRTENNTLAWASNLDLVELVISDNRTEDALLASEDDQEFTLAAEHHPKVSSCVPLSCGPNSTIQTDLPFIAIGDPISTQSVTSSLPKHTSSLALGTDTSGQTGSTKLSPESLGIPSVSGEAGSYLATSSSSAAIMEASNTVTSSINTAVCHTSVVSGRYNGRLHQSTKRNVLSRSALKVPEASDSNRTYGSYGSFSRKDIFLGTAYIILIVLTIFAVVFAWRVNNLQQILLERVRHLQQTHPDYTLQSSAAAQDSPPYTAQPSSNSDSYPKEGL